MHFSLARFLFFSFSYFLSLAFAQALASQTQTSPLSTHRIPTSNSQLLLLLLLLLLPFFLLNLLVYRWLPPFCINACNAALSSGEADFDMA